MNEYNCEQEALESDLIHQTSSNIEIHAALNENSINMNASVIKFQNDCQTNTEIDNQQCDTNEVFTVENNSCESLKIKQDKLIEMLELNISHEAKHFLQSQTNTSEVVLKKETESLKSLMTYNISSEDESSSDENPRNNLQYRQVSEISISSSSDSDSSDSESDSADSISEDSSSSSKIIEDNLFNTSNQSVENKGAVKKKLTKSMTPKTLGEMDLIDLPPLPDLSQLNIDYEKEEFIHIGNIQAVIDTIVTIEAFPNMPAYDLDTVLFIDHLATKKPLGTIFDVIGPVANPIYCIRFNSRKEIDEKKIDFGTQVYSAPKSKFTQYVFLKELMKIKGTDASWLGDNEMPLELAETSSEDDDSIYEKLPQCTKRKRGSFERHRSFERNMNRCNSLNTRLHKMVDAQNNGVPFKNNENVNVPLFNPSVPPPGFVNTMRFNIPANVNQSISSPDFVPPLPPPNFIPPQGRQYSRYPPLFSNQRTFSNRYDNRSNYSSPSNGRQYQW